MTLTLPLIWRRMAVLPRESIQMTAGRNGAPASSTATVPDHCAVHPTPMTLDGLTADCSSARRAAVTMAPHQAAGSCSAPPPGRRCSATGSDALAAIVPLGETTATLGPPVPRSTASTQASSLGTAADAPRSFPTGGIDAA